MVLKGSKHPTCLSGVPPPVFAMISLSTSGQEAYVGLGVRYEDSSRSAYTDGLGSRLISRRTLMWR